MEQYVPILLDVLVVVVIISMVKASARRGFVRTVIQFAGYLVSLGISSVVSRMAAIFVYDSFVRDGDCGFPLPQHPKCHRPGDGDGGTDRRSGKPACHPAKCPLPSRGGFDQRPLRPHRGFGGEDRRRRGGHGGGALRPSAFCGPSSLFLAFSTCMLFVKSFARLFRGLYRVPLLGPANALLGGLVGGLEAVLVLYVAAVLVSLLQTLTGDTLPLLTQEAVARTYLFRLFFDLNGIIGILGVQ